MEIVTETVNPHLLPSLPLASRRVLPHCPAIYFVLSGDEILYIGQTNSLLLRWQNHHRLKDCKSLKNVRIAWLECSDVKLMPEIEKSLINWFEPPMNSKFQQRSTKYGETKQRYQIMLTETASIELDRVSEKLGITRSELIERVIRQGFLEKVVLLEESA
ncbi:MAG: GIY-YIG nuclease family protein [Stigonema ocellatum SAG 48.90 = DSM 106950]|nr:GIY-YIG nuclease family protein [Stigonema ocellatum SAG 48.90 = DSM 106950]